VNPCSNPGKSPETYRKATTRKHGYLLAASDCWSWGFVQQPCSNP
jgi:hypothetical protein